MTIVTDPIIQHAIWVAGLAHKDQTDKLGKPYIAHPARVAAAIEAQPVGWSNNVVAAAWLHDVVEDSEFTLEDLRMFDFSAYTVHLVDLLTHRRNERREDYYERVKTEPAAVAIKLADIDDNTSPERMAGLDRETRWRLTAKYAKARAILAS